ncbi:MAG: DNA polymerase domain-containing protein [Promethearchaeota archaeon]
MNAWLLDLNLQGDRIALWLKHPSKIMRKLIKYQPTFYVVPQKIGYAEMEKILESHSHVDQVELVQRFYPIQAHKTRPVFRVLCDRLSTFARTWRDIENLERAKVCNVDFPLVQKWMYETGFFPMARIKYSVGDTVNALELCDSRETIQYEIPDLKRIKLEIGIKTRYLVVRKQDPLKWIRIHNGEEILIEKITEHDMLLELIRTIRELDPDIIVTDNGDNFLFPYLIARASKYGLLNIFTFSRDGIPLHKCLHKFHGSGSYFSYGIMYYRPSRQFYLHGRIHIDEGSGTHAFPMQGLPGMVEVARITLSPMQKVSRITIGQAMTSMQFYKAHQLDILIPQSKTNTAEYFKSGSKILQSDRGGFIYSPIVGFYENVAETDFSSMYPSIMLTRNISPETVLCSCQDSPLKVPELGYNVCNKREGLVPQALKLVLAKRQAYKKLAKQGPNKERYSSMEKALKWILVTCFDPNTTVPISKRGTLRLVKIGKFINDVLEDKEDLDATAVIGVDKTFKTKFNPIKRAFRLKSPSELYRIKLETGHEFSITKDHTCYVLSNGNLAEKKANELKKGEFLPFLLKIPKFPSQNYIDVITRLLKIASNNDLDRWRVKGPDLPHHILLKKQEIKDLMHDYHGPESFYNWINSNFIPLRYFKLLEIPKSKWKDLEVGYESRIGEEIHWLPAYFQIDGDLAFFLGYFIGDGSAQPRFIQLSVNSVDKDLIVWFEEFTSKRFNSILHKRKEPHTKMFTLQINASTLFQVLTKIFELAPTRAQGKLHVPSIILNGSKEAILGFFGGLIASDGNVHPYRKIVRITSRDYDFIQELSYLAALIGLYTTLQISNPQEGTPIFKVSFSGTTALTTLLKSGYIKQVDEAKIQARLQKTGDRAKANGLPVEESKLLFLACKAHTTRDPRISGKGRASQGIIQILLQQIAEKTDKLDQNDIKQIEIIKKLTNSDLGFARITHITPVTSKTEYVYCFEVTNHYPGFIAGSGGIFSHNCFGYTGYRNARFGRIEAHESVTAWARKILLEAAEIAEEFNLEIIHGIVDSLWLNGSIEDKIYEQYCKAVTTATNIEMKHKGTYKWVVFLPTKAFPTVGALTHYYGVFRDGKIKVRGLELRRHDTPLLIKKVQNEILDLLAKANNWREFQAFLPKAHKILRHYIDRLMQWDIAPTDLLIKMRISRHPEEYKNNSRQAIAAWQAKRLGMELQPGQMVQYLITNAQAKRPHERVLIAQLINRTARLYDRYAYRDLLERMFENMLLFLNARERNSYLLKNKRLL